MAAQLSYYILSTTQLPYHLTTHFGVCPSSVWQSDLNKPNCSQPFFTNTFLSSFSSFVPVNPNRGNVLFAKRVQKSITDGWIVDDVAEQVIDAARDKLFRNLKANHSASSSPIPSMSPYSRYSSPIAGPVFTPVASSLPPSRPASAMGLMFKDFNSRPKPFCRAF